MSHAMKAADSIRRHFAEANETGGSTPRETELFTHVLPPGIVPCIGAVVFAGVALLPVRRLVLGHPSINTHQAFRNFVDLVVSVGHALVATQAGLMAGSLYGGKTYLDGFVKGSVSAESPSPFSDAACKDIRSNILPPSQLLRSEALDSGSFDPRIQTMISLQRVIEKCQMQEECRD
jgi:hypothetical protein